MARSDRSHPDNIEGPWFVDDRCSRCDRARHWAPDLIGTDEHGRSFVARQPADEAEEAAMWRAAAACPTLSIGNRQARRPARAPFPHQLTPGVYALGHNAPASFGAHSYLATRPGGNLMFDSPRFTRPLAEAVDALGGIAHVLLSHRDDVADSMDRLAGLRVEWVFPGHGRWGHVGADGYASQMGGLGPAMRETGRDGWARRPATAFDWC